MTYLLYPYLFIFGLIFGSFLNVATIRYNPDRGFSNFKLFGGRSHCPNCHTQLVWYELFPLFSFLFLRGKCRHCQHRISWQYPLVEFLTGLIFVSVPWYVTNGLQTLLWNRMVLGDWVFATFSALWIAMFVLFLVLAIIDFNHMIIPDAINLSLAGLGFAITALTRYVGGFGAFYGSFLRHYAAIFGLRDSIWMNHLAAAAIGLVFFGGIILLSRGRAMGWGDFKLAGALGLIFGWPDVILVLFFSFIIGSVVSLGLLFRRKKHMKDMVPFGPFLVIGSAVLFFFGFRLMTMYFNLFGIL